MQMASRPHPKRAFSDRYRAALLVLAILLCSLCGSAQIFQYPNPGLWGQGLHRFVPDSTLYFPTGCGAPSGIASLNSYGFTGFGQKIRQAAIYADTCGKHVYWFNWTDSTWRKLDTNAVSLNFANTDLSATGTRLHNWKGTYDLTIDSLRSLLLYSRVPSGIGKSSINLHDSTGQLLASAPGATSYITYTPNGISLQSGGKMYVQDDSSTLAPAGYVWTLADPSTGMMRLRPISGGGGTPSNPSAKVGLAAVNGTATTYMRSDAAPPLDTTGANIHTDGFNLAKYKRAADSAIDVHSYTTRGRLQQVLDSLNAQSDTTNYRSSGSGAPGSYNPTFNYSQSGHQITITWIPNRDSLDFHSVLAGDSVRVPYVQAHDTSSANALQSKYRSDTGRTNVYNALSLKKNITDSSASGPSNYVTQASRQKLSDSLQAIFNAAFVKNGGAATKITVGPIGSRPAASNCQCFWVSATDSSITYDNGGWIPLGKGGSGGGGGTPAGSNKQVQINNSGSFGVVTNFTADPSTQTVNADTLAAHKAKLDSIQLSHSYYAAPTKMIVGGDSYSSNPPVRPDGTGTPYYNQVNTQWGSLPITNIATSGMGIFNAVYQFNQQTIPITALSMFMVDLNDLRFNSTALTFNKCLNGWNTLYSIQFAKTAVDAGTGSGFTRFGTWTTSKAYNNITYGGRFSTGAYTITPNDSIKYTATLPSQGGAIGLWLMGSLNNYATWNLYADSLLVMQGSSSQRTDGVTVTGHADNFMPYALIWNFPSGSHTLRLVKTSSAADTLGVDGGFIMQDSSTATPFVMWDQPLLDSTGYATSPNQSSALICNTMNAIHDSLWWTWDQRYPLRHVKTNNFWNPLRDLSSDHIHPRGNGDNVLAYGGITAFPYNNSGYFKNILMMDQNRMASFTDGRHRNILYADETNTQADRLIDKYRASAGSISGTLNYIPLFTSTTTIGPSIINQVSSKIGINKASPSTILHLGVTNDGIQLDNANTSNSFGLFSNIAMWGVNRNPFNGNIQNTAAAAASIYMTSASGQGSIQFSTGTTNNAAPTVRGNIWGSGHLVWGGNISDDNTIFQANQWFQLHGGMTIYAQLTNPVNTYSFIHQGDGQFGYTDSANANQYLGQINQSDHAWIFGITNGTHSWTKDTAFRITSNGDVKFTSTLQSFRGTHNVVTGYNATDDGINKFQNYGTAKITDTLKLTKLPNKASLAGTDSVLIADISGNVHKAPSSSVGGASGYTTVQNNTSSITARAKINLPSGSGLTFTDNSGNTSSDLTITSVPSAATATTQVARDSSKKVATTEYVDQAAKGFAGAYTVAAGTNVASVTAGFMRYTIVDSIVTVNVRGAWDVTTAGSLSTINVTIPVTCSSYLSSREGSYMGEGTWYSAGTSDLVPIGALMTNSTTVQLFCKPPVATSTSFSATFIYHQ